MTTPSPSAHDPHTDPTRAARWGEIVLLAIDPGFTTGWALSTGATGTKTFGREDYGRLAADFRGWLLNMIDEHRPTAMVIELPFSRMSAHDRASFGLAFIAHECAWCHDLQRDEIAPGTLKKAVTGSGRASKAEVQAAVRSAGWTFDSEHAADAAALVMAWQVRHEAQQVAA